MTILKVVNLEKDFGEKKIIQPISFTLEPNTSTALIGPNGAGKTTIMSMIAGLLQPTRGTVQFGMEKDIRGLIGFLPQYPNFYPYLSALEYVEMAATLSNVSKKEIKTRSKDILEYVGLGEHLTSKISTFSGGMKQRLGIAQAIIHQPKLLLLDEPVSALDPVGRLEVMKLIKDLEKSMTILYSTHILNDAQQMANQVIFLKQGMIVENGSLANIQQKYAAPRILIQFDTIEDAITFGSINNFKVIDQCVIIDLLTTPMQMKEVLRLLYEQTYSVQKVERVTASLEEIFMKVVQQ